MPTRSSANKTDLVTAGAGFNADRKLNQMQNIYSTIDVLLK